MKKKVARDERKRETRDALVRAAAAEMAEKGIEAASLNAICDRAGFTRGAFYVHFRDRDDLVAAVVERVLGDFKAALLPDGASPALGETINRFVAAVLAGVPEAVGTSRWKFHHTLTACATAAPIRKKYNALQYRALDRLADGARAGQKDGSVLRDVRARPLAEMLLVLTLGVSVATDLGLEIDYAAGAATLRKLLAPRG
ncbi:MAG TPA: TetR/AcrR family transcriptional regulator [Polyangiaceae bacterium]|jgi:AcrR family transcriptional regulator